MLKEPVDTSMNPTGLSDFELLRYAEDYVHTDGLPKTFQRELVRRFAQKLIGSI